MSSSLRVAATVAALALAGLGALWLTSWRAARERSREAPESAAQALCAGGADGTLSTGEVRAVLVELREAAEEARAALSAAVARRAPEGSESAELKAARQAAGVQVIVRALEPVTLAQARLREQRGVGQHELQLAIASCGADVEIQTLNAKLGDAHAAISELSRQLVA
jgi:hypothetical protein